MSAKDITPEDEYQYRYKYRSKGELKLARKYNCDGLCYGNKFICPLVDNCPQTRFKEKCLLVIVNIVIILTIVIFFIILMILIIGLGGV